MEKIDWDAEKKLASILHSRGVDFDTALTISLMVRYVTQTMIDWLEGNPDASITEILHEARELNREDVKARAEGKRGEELRAFMKYRE